MLSGPESLVCHRRTGEVERLTVAKRFGSLQRAEQKDVSATAADLLVGF